jgi:hypothetical protein
MAGTVLLRIVEMRWCGTLPVEQSAADVAWELGLEEGTSLVPRIEMVLRVFEELLELGKEAVYLRVQMKELRWAARQASWFRLCRLQEC